MSNRLRNEAWLRSHDPREREKDYEEWRNKHRDFLRQRARAHLNAIAGAGPLKTESTLIASVTGLSTSTVTRYLVKKDMGKRGPLLTTYLALRALGQRV